MKAEQRIICSLNKIDQKKEVKKKMKIKLHSVIENVSRANKKYWKIKLRGDDGSKISFIIDINKNNYEGLNMIHEKEVDVKDSLIPAITAQGEYQGSPYVTRTLKGKNINEFMSAVYGVQFENDDILASFFSRGFVEPEAVVVGSVPEENPKKIEGLFN